jgi:hypothetical protein
MLIVIMLSVVVLSVMVSNVCSGRFDISVLSYLIDEVSKYQLAPQACRLYVLLYSAQNRRHDTQHNDTQHNNTA